MQSVLRLPTADVPFRISRYVLLSAPPARLILSQNMDESFRTPVELRSAMPYLEGRSVSIEQLSNARAEFERLGRMVSAVRKVPQLRFSAD